MKFLLAAINAKYIHSNPAVYSLRAFAKKRMPGVDIQIGEYTINHQMDQILQDIYRRKPDFVGFSCYIWNISYVYEIVQDLHKVLPETEIWLGGPEVSYDAGQVLEREPEVRGIMRGEGELTFSEIAAAYMGVCGGCAEAGQNLDAGSGYVGAGQGLDGNDGMQGAVAIMDSALCGIRGITFRSQTGQIIETPAQRLLSMDELPFCYADNRTVGCEGDCGDISGCKEDCGDMSGCGEHYSDISGFENRIVYYESSRGCPFSCSYCLSSIDKSVRFRSLSLVKRELDFFLEHKVPQVKFVDRTFNCRREHTLGIWRHIIDHDNGITNFHFEVSADLFDEEELALIGKMRPGLIQLEIGVQSTNPDTIREIRRKMDLNKLKAAVSRVHSYGNTHQHLDLIAGLPYEGLESFCRSFDDVYRMTPDQLQLGFLKVLKGSYMEEQARSYDLKYQSVPTYEVLSTRWLSYKEVIRLKAMEEMVEVHYNSGQFKNTIRLLEKEFSSPSAMFLALADYYGAHGLFGLSHSRTARYEILYDFLRERLCGQERKLSHFRDSLMLDLYLRENVKSRPSFASGQSPFKKQIREFFMAEEKKPVWLCGYEGYDSRQMSKMAHLEAMEDGTFVLFDYKNRDPLDHNARAVRFSYSERGEYGKEGRKKARKEGDEEGQRSESGRDFKGTGYGVWHRIPLLSES